MSKPNPWADISVKTTDGQSVKLAEQWATQKTVLFLVRRFGCALCQNQGSSMMELKAALDKAGVAVKFIAVGSGSKHFSDKFKLGVPWEGSVYLDETYTTHKAINLIRFSAWQALKRWFSPKALSFSKKLFARFKRANMKGDGLQSGGIFIVGPGVDSPIQFSFLEAESSVDVGANIHDMFKLITGKPLNDNELITIREELALKITKANDLTVNVADAPASEQKTTTATAATTTPDALATKETPVTVTPSPSSTAPESVPAVSQSDGSSEPVSV